MSLEPQHPELARLLRLHPAFLRHKRIEVDDADCIWVQGVGGTRQPLGASDAVPHIREVLRKLGNHDAQRQLSTALRNEERKLLRR